MLSPSTSADASLPTNLRPMMNACARPSGDGCTAYERLTPHSAPSHHGDQFHAASAPLCLARRALVSAATHARGRALRPWLRLARAGVLGRPGALMRTLAHS